MCVVKQSVTFYVFIRLCALRRTIACDGVIFFSVQKYKDVIRTVKFEGFIETTTHEVCLFCAKQ
jgi:hypothetical protein